MPEDDIEQFLEPLQPLERPISDNKDMSEEQKALELLDLIKSNEKRQKELNNDEKDDEKDDENIKDGANKDNTVESLPTDNKNKMPDNKGRKRKIPGDKGKLLNHLRRIWKSRNSKATEICSAASLYAELMGYKQKAQDSLENKEIMRIEFDIAKRPSNQYLANNVANKMVDSVNFTKDISSQVNSTTPNNANEPAQLEALNDINETLDTINKTLDEQVDALDDFNGVDLLSATTTTLDNTEDKE